VPSFSLHLDPDLESMGRRIMHLVDAIVDGRTV